MPKGTKATPRAIDIANRALAEQEAKERAIRDQAAKEQDELDRRKLAVQKRRATKVLSQTDVGEWFPGVKWQFVEVAYTDGGGTIFVYTDVDSGGDLGKEVKIGVVTSHTKPTVWFLMYKKLAPPREFYELRLQIKSPVDLARAERWWREQTRIPDNA